MLLNELEPGTVIQVEAARGVRTMGFETTVIETEGTQIKIEPILQEGKLVGFDAGGIVVTIYIPNREDGKVYKFNCVAIRSLKSPDGKIYQEISCNTVEGKVANRRSAVRVWVGENGKMKIGSDTTTYDVVVKDISATGIAVVCDESINVNMGDVLLISFRDESKRQEFKLNAFAVRHEEGERKNIIYGCKFSNELDLISRYVIEKQRENLKATRTVNAANAARRRE